MTGDVRAANELIEDLELSCDVCVVGSGAGGAVLAARLAAAGLSVVMLEEGGAFGRADFRMQEREAYRDLYQERGLRGTDDLAITVFQGKAVGGSTLVNWTTCFRVPDDVLVHWRDRHGVEGLGPEVLAPHFEAVEERLSITTWPEALANENNRVLLEGCRRLGWEVNPLRRNVRHCANTGYCGMGCPVDAKTDMHLTYLPDALERGMTLLTRVRAERIEVRGDRATGVVGWAMDPATDRPTGRRVRVRAQAVSCSAGALNSPMLLLRSGLDDGKVGRRTFLHPTVAMVALFDREIRPFYGAPQSIGSHQFAQRGEGKMGFFLETPPIHPMLAATAYPAFGVEQQAFLSQLAHVQGLISLSIDGFLPGDVGGRVSLGRGGKMCFDYPVRGALEESFRASCVAMARIQLAAGAREVRSLHRQPVVVRSEKDLPKLEAAPYGALRHAIFSAHQMGGCAMGEDPARAVVDSRLRHHRIRNLHVVDGSVFPTSLGVNPSETIYALAHWAAEHVAASV